MRSAIRSQKAMNPIILYRQSVMDQAELDAAKQYFTCVDSIVDVPDGSLVIARYSVLPFYKEVERDLLKHGSKLLNTYHQHRFVADLGNYTELLGDLTPRTYLLEDTPDTGPFIVKGETNSKRSLWKTHMYAANRQEAIQVACRLMEDSLISEQRIYVRDFIPLETFGVGVDGVPIAREFRFFVLDGTVLCGAYYWANHTEFLTEHNIPTPRAEEVPLEFLKRVTESVGANIRFYVIDVAKTASGEWIVVELNDGQQSGLSENEPEKLYGALATHLRDDLCLTCKKNRGEARYDEGLACGRHCDTCWGAMLAECRSRSW